MCNEKSCCEHPEKKVKDPKECAPEQIENAIQNLKLIHVPKYSK